MLDSAEAGAYRPSGIDRQSDAFEVESRPDAAIVHVHCEVDIANKERFYEALMHAWNNRPKRLVVSLENCRYMDCTGLSALIRVRIVTRAPMAVVIGAGSPLRWLFSVTGLDVTFPVADTVRAAVGRLTMSNGHRVLADDHRKKSRGTTNGASTH